MSPTLQTARRGVNGYVLLFHTFVRFTVHTRPLSLIQRKICIPTNSCNDNWLIVTCKAKIESAHAANALCWLSLMVRRGWRQRRRLATGSSYNYYETIRAVLYARGSKQHTCRDASMHICHRSDMNLCVWNKSVAYKPNAQWAPTQRPPLWLGGEERHKGMPKQILARRNRRGCRSDNERPICEYAECIVHRRVS